MSQQESLMMFDPATGESPSFPSHAAQWRKHCGQIAWLFNPWTGLRRDARDIGSDTFGLLIIPPGEEVVAAQETRPEEQARPVIGVTHQHGPECPCFQCTVDYV